MTCAITQWTPLSGALISLRNHTRRTRLWVRDGGVRGMEASSLGSDPGTVGRRIASCVEPLRMVKFFEDDLGSGYARIELS